MELWVRDSPLARGGCQLDQSALVVVEVDEVRRLLEQHRQLGGFLAELRLAGFLPVDITHHMSASDIEGPAKPAPGIYRAAADRLGVSPADCLAVEDSTHGIAAATRAGMTFLALRGDGNVDSNLSAADAVVDSPAGLRATLRDRLDFG